MPGPGGGRKGSNYVDVTATRDGKTVRVQTVSTNADGVTPTAQEARAAKSIRSKQKPGDHTVLIPKKKDE
jgi:filamentous hemagglutinin